MRTLAAALLLTALVVGLYARTKDHPYSPHDDPLYVSGRPEVRAGLTAGSVRWALATSEDSNRIPLTWASHMAVVELAGLDPGAHHLANVALHLGNVLALFLLVKRLTGEVWTGALAGALLAVHPIHVESVAWVSERKDVLALFLGLATLHAYVSYARRPSVARYLLVAFLLALGLSAKAMLVTLPCVMVLLDAWPLGRVERPALRSLGLRLLEKAPLLALSALASAATLAAQARTETMQSYEILPLRRRLATVVVGYGGYLRKLVWPADLCPFYPYELEIPIWRILLSLVVLAGLTLWTVRLARSRPWLAVGWLWFLGTLFPFSGITQSGGQSMADRYAYLPAIGLYLAGSLEAARLAKGRPRLAAALAVGAVAWLVPWNWAQVGRWSSTEILYRHALAVTEENGVAHGMLGTVELERGNLEAAAGHYVETIRISPGYFNGYLGMGQVHAAAGQDEVAVEWFRKALDVSPEAPDVHFVMAESLRRLGRLEEALAAVDRELEITPWHDRAWNTRGHVLVAMRRFDEGVAAFQRSIELQPVQFEAPFNLGSTYLLFLDRPGDAVPPLEAAAALRPDDPTVQGRLREARGRAGR